MIELANNEADRQVMEFLSADIPISRAYVTTPGTPPDRVEALRRAFDATMKDPLFLAEAAKSNTDINPSTGEESQKFAAMIANTPPSVLAKAKMILDVK
jgi:tripartite-type tricarboxylate transporter receptor subunit TctC